MIRRVQARREEDLRASANTNDLQVYPSSHEPPAQGSRNERETPSVDMDPRPAKRVKKEEPQ